MDKLTINCHVLDKAAITAAMRRFPNEKISVTHVGDVRRSVVTCTYEHEKETYVYSACGIHAFLFILNNGPSNLKARLLRMPPLAKVEAVNPEPVVSEPQTVTDESRERFVLEEVSAEKTPVVYADVQVGDAVPEAPVESATPTMMEALEELHEETVIAEGTDRLVSGLSVIATAMELLQFAGCMGWTAKESNDTELHGDKFDCGVMIRKLEIAMKAESPDLMEVMFYVGQLNLLLELHGGISRYDGINIYKDKNNGAQ